MEYGLVQTGDLSWLRLLALQCAQLVYSSNYVVMTQLFHKFQHLFPLCYTKKKLCRCFRKLHNMTPKIC